MPPPPFKTAWRPGAIPPSWEPPVEQAAIKNAIECQNDKALLQQLADNPHLPSETLLNLLEYAIQKKSSLTVKEVILQHHGCVLQSALALAVQYNDIPIAKQVLQRGADPEKITAFPNNGDMRTLLTYARRKNKLYPPNAPPAQETDLDCALRDGLYDNKAREDAENLLNQAIHGENKVLRFLKQAVSGGINVQKTWRDAVKENQIDIQRAILLLGYADHDRGFRLLQEDAVKDKGVTEVMKEIPYFSPKRKSLQNFNDKVLFPGKDEKIACRHLVEHRQEVQKQTPQIKFDASQYASPEAVAYNVSCDTHAKFMHLTTHATEARLFNNRAFGKTLVQQFSAMAAEGELTRLISLISTNHAMGVELKIKEKSGRPHYVAKLFDPNRTTSHVSVTSDSLHTFETLTLENFIANENLYKKYYPEPEGYSSMFVRPNAQEEQGITDPAQGVVENRALTSSIENKEINATVLWHMLTYGFAADLRYLKDEIVSRPMNEQIQLLAAKSTHYPGLFMALQNGHADAIKAFDELFGEVSLHASIEQCTELLAAKDTRNIPGLFMAFKNGHAGAIKSFCDLLSRVPAEPRVELLGAEYEGMSGLFVALGLGHAGAVKAFGELLLLMPDGQRARLLTVRSEEGLSGVAVALKEGKLEALEQYIEIIKKTAPTLSVQERADLLKYIQESHAVQTQGMWTNSPYYETLKEESPDFYLRFEEMKNALITPDATRTTRLA